MSEDDSEREVGVGPHPEPWPDDPRLDRELLAEGDRRNVVDAYRYWTREAIVADLDQRRHEFHVAVENWQHDFNIGTIVRNGRSSVSSRRASASPHTTTVAPRPSPVKRACS